MKSLLELLEYEKATIDEYNKANCRVENAVKTLEELKVEGKEGGVAAGHVRAAMIDSMLARQNADNELTRVKADIRLYFQDIMWEDGE